MIPLQADCSIRATRDPNVFAVECSSNRKGNVTVDILSCDVDGEIMLDQFCMLILVCHYNEVCNSHTSGWILSIN